MHLHPPARSQANRGAVTQAGPFLHRLPAFGSTQQLVHGLVKRAAASANTDSLGPPQVQPVPRSVQRVV